MSASNKVILLLLIFGQSYWTKVKAHAKAIRVNEIAELKIDEAAAGRTPTKTVVELGATVPVLPPVLPGLLLP